MKKLLSFFVIGLGIGLSYYIYSSPTVAIVVAVIVAFILGYLAGFVPSLILNRQWGRILEANGATVRHNYNHRVTDEPVVQQWQPGQPALGPGQAHTPRS